ncbi:MAG: cytochrome c [Gammaproteobacteria bacterium]
MTQRDGLRVGAPRGTRGRANGHPSASVRLIGWGIVLVAGLSLPAYGQAPDLQRGRALYENHCQSCHESWVHERMRHVHSLQALEQRVNSWQIHAGLSWTAEDIADVTAYLNRNFYHFKPASPAPQTR